MFFDAETLAAISLCNLRNNDRTQEITITVTMSSLADNQTISLRGIDTLYNNNNNVNFPSSKPLELDRNLFRGRGLLSFKKNKNNDNKNLVEEIEKNIMYGGIDSFYNNNNQYNNSSYDYNNKIKSIPKSSESIKEKEEEVVKFLKQVDVSEMARNVKFLRDTNFDFVKDIRQYSKRVGKYTLAERKEKISKFRERRARSKHSSHQYVKRRAIAQQRTRIGGRFVSKKSEPISSGDNCEPFLVTSADNCEPFSSSSGESVCSESCLSCDDSISSSD